MLENLIFFWIWISLLANHKYSKNFHCIDNTVKKIKKLQQFMEFLASKFHCAISQAINESQKNFIVSSNAQRDSDNCVLYYLIFFTLVFCLFRERCFVSKTKQKPNCLNKNRIWKLKADYKKAIKKYNNITFVCEKSQKFSYAFEIKCLLCVCRNGFI